MPGTNRKPSKIDYKKHTPQPVSHPCSPTNPEDLEWVSHKPNNLTPTQPPKKDENGPGVIGAAKRVYMDTRIGIATTRTHNAHDYWAGDAWSPTTTAGTTCTVGKKTVPMFGSFEKID